MSDIPLGRPQVRPDASAHVPGVRQGNHKGLVKRQPGHRSDGRSTARRSTGIGPRARNPVLPGMPNLSPA
ncbi:hypothetical protein AB0K89_17085 [Streptomyces cinnamoneus]|uniref:hypothetical protein n=1 Tax=Streptomyces cinnamoneus TaxID=53446 RepID=UPI003442C304